MHGLRQLEIFKILNLCSCRHFFKHPMGRLIAGTCYELCYVYHNNDSGIMVKYVTVTSNLL
jgi:hypothetical protein